MKKGWRMFGVLFTLLLIFSIPVQAKEVECKTISDLSKSWTIKFNKATDNKSINNSNIYIKDSQGKNINSTLKTYDSGDKVTIIPTEKYTAGEKYTIYVTKEIKDKSGANLKEETYMNFNVKESVKEDISKNPNYYVKEEITSDVNGDGKKEKIQVVCNKTDDDGDFVYHEEIRVLIKDNSTEEVLEEINPSNMGYISPLETYDFNKDGSMDIMISLPSGGSCGDISYEIYSFKNNNLTQILGKNNSSGLIFPDEYVEFNFSKDDEEVEIWSDNYNKRAKFNFSNYWRKPESNDYQGGFALFYLHPINKKSNGECDLKTTACLWTDYKENIAIVQTTYVWDKIKGMWIIENVEFLPGDDSIYEVKEKMELEEFKIENLEIGMNSKEIEKIIGEPVNVKKNYNDAIGVDIVTYEYKNYTIEFIEDENAELIAFNIASKSSETIGPKEIKIGNSVEEVLKKFTREGNPIEHGEEILYGEEYKNNGKIHYDENGNISKLTFQYGEGTFDVVMFELEINNNKVSNMKVWMPII